MNGIWRRAEVPALAFGASNAKAAAFAQRFFFQQAAPMQPVTFSPRELSYDTLAE
jgi:hypothetical protein